MLMRDEPVIGQNCIRSRRFWYFLPAGIPLGLEEIPSGMPSKVQGKDGNFPTSLMWLKFPYRDQNFWSFFKKYKQNKMSVTAPTRHLAL